jgi:hypothetical protein
MCCQNQKHNANMLRYRRKVKEFGSSSMSILGLESRIISLVLIVEYDCVVAL